MIRLVLAELGRLRSRRMTLVTAIVVLGVLALFQLLVNSEVTPPSPADVAQQQQYYDEAHRDWEQNHVEQEQECTQSGGDQEECAIAEPTPADYALTPTAFAEIGEIAMYFAAFTAMLAAYLLCASFIGAEYSTGSLANWLTFVPQRLLVYFSKLTAAVLASALLGALVSFLTLGVAALLTRVHGGGLAGAGHLGALGGRAVVLAALAGMIGFVCALLSRHTVAAVGLVLGYLVVAYVVRGLAYNVPFFGRLPPWMPDQNVQAFLQHGSTYEVPVVTTTPDGTSVDSIEKHLSFAHSGVYWLVFAVVAIGVGAAVFRRRDVT